jgi:alanine-synthesizing transaminase
MDILEQEKILLVQGSAFNIQDSQHFRLVFLPREDELKQAVLQIARVLEQYR